DADENRDSFTTGLGDDGPGLRDSIGKIRRHRRTRRPPWQLLPGGGIDRLPLIGNVRQQRLTIEADAVVALRRQAPLQVSGAEQWLADRHIPVDADTAIVFGLFRLAHFLAGGADAVYQGRAVVAQVEVAHVGG